MLHKPMKIPLLMKLKLLHLLVKLILFQSVLGPDEYILQQIY